MEKNRDSFLLSTTEKVTVYVLLFRTSEYDLKRVFFFAKFGRARDNIRKNNLFRNLICPSESIVFKAEPIFINERKK